ncbi:DnaD domain protein [Streptococcus sanguinis]|uniref:DnaD domain protein n=1 Tax=Streptococcus sanguinis TaxID=1305 RepID=A0A7H8VA39_STRSA|nr:DnaD domain protein [Streptococcus sanguinis]
MAKTKVYFWLKVDKKFFDNIFIKKLKNIAGGYTMTVIYIRLMLESLESDCILYYEGYFNDLAEELALKLDVSEDDIRMTLSYFTQCGLIQVDSDSNAEMAQAKALVQQETNQAAYMRQYRKEQKEKKNNLTMLSENLTTLTTCKTEIELEIEKEIEKEIEIESEERDREKISSAASAEISKYYQSRIGVIDGVQYQQLMDYHTQDKLELDLIKLAIDKAADNGKRSFGYVNTILKNWAQNGIKTVAQQEEEQQRYIADKGHAQKTVNVTDPFGGNLG